VYKVVCCNKLHGSETWPVLFIHPLTSFIVISHPLYASSICYDPWNPPPPIQFMCLTVFFQICLQVFFDLPLGLAPSTLFSIHFFTQSLSSLRNTCPYHRNLFRYSTTIMSSNLSLSLNPLLGKYLVALRHTSVWPFSSLPAEVLPHFPFLWARSHYHATYYFAVRTQLLYNPSHYQWYILIGKQWYQLPEFTQCLWAECSRFLPPY